MDYHGYQCLLGGISAASHGSIGDKSFHTYERTLIHAHTNSNARNHTIPYKQELFARGRAGREKKRRRKRKERRGWEKKERKEWRERKTMREKRKRFILLPAHLCLPTHLYTFDEHIEGP